MDFGGPDRPRPRNSPAHPHTFFHSPVAILAKRGQCSYETKARVAQTLTTPHGAVRFVIVYNDDRRAGQGLITMAPRTPDRVGTDKIGLVFVSYENGVGEFFLFRDRKGVGSNRHLPVGARR